MWCVARFSTASACNFTKSNAPPWVFFTFFKLYEQYQIAQSTTYVSLHKFTKVFLLFHLFIRFQRALPSFPCYPVDTQRRIDVETTSCVYYKKIPHAKSTRQLLYITCLNAKSPNSFQKQPPEWFYKNDVFKNFTKFTEKHMCHSLFFDQVAILFKVVSPTFLLVCFLSLDESTCQTRENVIYFTSKALFVSEKIKFQNSIFSNFMTPSNT